MISAVNFPMQLFKHIVDAVRLRWVKAPTIAKLTEWLQRIKRRVDPFLQWQRLLHRDTRQSYTWLASVSTRARWARYGGTRPPTAWPCGVARWTQGTDAAKPVRWHCRTGENDVNALPSYGVPLGISEIIPPVMNGCVSGARIAILHDARQPRSLQDNAMIAWIARRWVELGYRVSHRYGPCEAVEADLLIVHVDMSVVPDDYLRFAERFPITVNASLSDIRKRQISTNLVTRDDDYQGPVIVKTDLNFGGLPEMLVDSQLALPPLSLMQRARRKLKIKDPTAIRSPENYLIYDTKNAVPAKIFDNPNLVIERFLAERHSGEYYHRRYFYFGDAEYNVVWAGNAPINAFDDDGDRHWVEPVPPELRIYRKQLGADYGKIDYVIVDNKVEIFDVNRTPGGRVDVEDPVDAQHHRETVERLAPGISGFLPVCAQQ